MGVETEIKLRWTGGADAARSLLLSHGYAIRTGGQLEVDQLYDHPAFPLRPAGKLLRLRSAGDRWIVTFKGPRFTEADGSAVHKSREEIETSIGDGAAFEAILERIGYQPGFRYEKFRTTFALAGEPGIVTLDQTVMGDFLELEGPAEWIDRTALALGFGPADYIKASYAGLYAEYRKQHPEQSPNMTF
ncbi:MAG: class IV adenylate cyclase [Acidobacteriota bacterium]